MTAVPVIDAHIHFWRLARGDYSSLTPDMPILLRDHLPEDLAPHLAAAGVDRIVVVQAAETLAETGFMLELGARTPFIAGVVGWYDPTTPDAAVTLDGLAAHPLCKGFRPVRADNVSIAWLTDEAAHEGLALLAPRGLTLDLLVQNPDEVPLATQIIARHPDLTIVLDHCAKPDIAGGRFEPWATDIAALARHPNAVCKLSGLLNRAKPGARSRDIGDYARHVLDCFGPARTLWASDWPPLRLAADYETWWQVSCDLLADVSDEERRDVLAGTAQRVYRLGRGGRQS